MGSEAGAQPQRIPFGGSILLSSRVQAEGVTRETSPWKEHFTNSWPGLPWQKEQKRAGEAQGLQGAQKNEPCPHGTHDDI